MTLVRFIEAIQPITKVFPSIKKPERKVGFNEKLLWTAVALILYLIMTEIPLYGIKARGSGDPLDPALRVIFASSRGTLMELGIGPIVTAGLILQILAGSKMIKVDFTKSEDRSMFTAASKVFSVFMTIFEGTAYMIGGAWGVDLTPQVEAIILAQLICAGVVLMLMDEMLQKGWGIGSGISLFIAAGVAQQIWWNTFAPFGPMGDGKYLGAVLAFLQTVLAGESLRQVFLRTGGLPDVIGLSSTIFVMVMVVYLYGLRIHVPVSYAKYRGFRGKFPIKLLYVSNIPVIFSAALFGNIYFVSQIIWARLNPQNTNFWLNLLGRFKTAGQPDGGLVYYVIPPRTFQGFLDDPVRAGVYAALLIAACAFFAVTWVEVGGMNAKTVSKQLLDSGMQVEGFRRSDSVIEGILGKYIPTVTLLGGMLIGAIAACADFLGAFGTGTGILLTVGILEQYYQMLVKERISEFYPAMRGILGK